MVYVRMPLNLDRSEVLGFISAARGFTTNPYSHVTEEEHRLRWEYGRTRYAHGEVAPCIQRAFEYVVGTSRACEVIEKFTQGESLPRWFLAQFNEKEKM